MHDAFSYLHVVSKIQLSTNHFLVIKQIKQVWMVMYQSGRVKTYTFYARTRSPNYVLPTKFKNSTFNIEYSFQQPITSR